MTKSLWLIIALEIVMMIIKTTTFFWWGKSTFSGYRQNKLNLKIDRSSPLKQNGFKARGFF